uniref:Secreted protein n=1 Tax=Zea mays TaxID=4577 RepID=B6TP09_MAIZE|nr:hypothetical protein [Zea mays]|eukprot:NP_001144227.1 uncharacterized protein LOC100277092 precursor [Zea mays]
MSQIACFLLGYALDCGCAAVGDGGMAPRAGAASPGHRVVGEGREPGAGAVGHGAQDAVRRIRSRTHRHVKDSEKRVLAREGANAARPVPGARQEAPRDPHQEHQTFIVACGDELERIL